MTNPTELLRTRRDGCYRLVTNAWGTFLRRTDDPAANGELEPDSLKSFELKEGIARIPADLWQRWVQLCFHFARTSNLEVAARFLRKDDDRTQWRIIVPVQSVSSGHVNFDLDGAIDIATGERIEAWPPAGWTPCGSTHSHHRMTISFSSVDDRDELKDPGLHVLIRSVRTDTNQYNIDASITADGRRFMVPYDKIIDATAVEGSTFHPDVLSIVTGDTFSSSLYGNVRSYPSGGSWQSRWSSEDQAAYQEWWDSQFLHNGNAAGTGDNQLNTSRRPDSSWAAASSLPGYYINQFETAIEEMICTGRERHAAQEVEQAMQTLRDLLMLLQDCNELFHDTSDDHEPVHPDRNPAGRAATPA